MNVHRVPTELTACGDATREDAPADADAPCHVDHGERAALSLVKADPELHLVVANHVHDTRFDIQTLRART